MNATLESSMLRALAEHLRRLAALLVTDRPAYVELHECASFLEERSIKIRPPAAEAAPPATDGGH